MIYRAPRFGAGRASAGSSPRRSPPRSGCSRRYVAVAALLAASCPRSAWACGSYNSPAALDAAVPPEVQELIAQERVRRLLPLRRRAELRRARHGQQHPGGVPRVRTRRGPPGRAPGWVLASNGLNLGVMAAVMHRAGEGAAVLGADPPPRAARAHRDHRRRRRRAAAVVGARRAR